MATWTTIPDTSLEPGKPIRSIDALALRDNPVAISEGASGAPKIDPINAMAHLGAAGAIGTYTFARSSTASDVAFGSTRAGSALLPTSAANGASSSTDGVNAFSLISGSALSGTWRCMGTYDHSAPMAGSVTGSVTGATLWLRIA